MHLERAYCVWSILWLYNACYYQFTRRDKFQGKIYHYSTFIGRLTADYANILGLKTIKKIRFIRLHIAN